MREDAYGQVNQQFRVNLAFQPSAALSSRVRSNDGLDSMRRRFVQACDMRAEQVRKKRFLSGIND